MLALNALVWICVCGFAVVVLCPHTVGLAAWRFERWLRRIKNECQRREWEERNDDDSK